MQALQEWKTDTNDNWLSDKITFHDLVDDYIDKIIWSKPLKKGRKPTREWFEIGEEAKRINQYYRKQEHNN